MLGDRGNEKSTGKIQIFSMKAISVPRDGRPTTIKTEEYEESDPKAVTRQRRYINIGGFH